MPISFDSALGIHPQALVIRARRAELLASNLANADTPGYKARDIDFKEALNASLQKPVTSPSNNDPLSSSPFSNALDQPVSANTLLVTNKRQIATPVGDRLTLSSTAMGNMAMEPKYRIPDHPSLDGNTVDALREKAAFAENALHYEASLTFLSGKFRGLMAAIKGE